MGYIDMMTAETVEVHGTDAALHVLERHKSGFYLLIIAELCGVYLHHPHNGRVRRSQGSGVL